jgi:hypothetical protein
LEEKKVYCKTQLILKGIFMDIGAYRHYLKQLVSEALENSDGTNAGISSYLWEMRIAGLIVLKRAEKKLALKDARNAFDDHRHWPLEIVISHLGIDPKELGVKFKDE